MAEDAEKKKKPTFGERLRGAVKKKAEQVTGRRAPDPDDEYAAGEYAGRIVGAMKKKK